MPLPPKFFLQKMKIVESGSANVIVKVATFKIRFIFSLKTSTSSTDMNNIPSRWLLLQQDSMQEEGKYWNIFRDDTYKKLFHNTLLTHPNYFTWLENCSYREVPFITLPLFSYLRNLRAIFNVQFKRINTTIMRPIQIQLIYVRKENMLKKFKKNPY